MLSSKQLTLFSFLLSALGFGKLVQGEVPWASQYNILWNSQSTDATGSMPLSGGNLGLNVWVEKNDLLLYMASTNSQSEKGMQVKLGRVRIRFTPLIFAKSFSQELVLGKSQIVLKGKTADDSAAQVTVWCDVDKPVIHVEIAASKAVDVSASYETWADQTIKKVGSALQWSDRLDPLKINRLAHIKSQKMEEYADAIPDPLTNLTLGGRIVASGMMDGGTSTGTYRGAAFRSSAIKTQSPVHTLDLRIVIRMEQDATLAVWEDSLAQAVAATATTLDADRTASLAWWDDFWNRSYIRINESTGGSDPAWEAGRNYQLERYLLASNRSGRFPLMFNAANFMNSSTPDDRQWASVQYMGQNQRLLAWPLFKSGDFDLLQPVLNFYRDRTAMNYDYAQKWWGVEGLVFPETFGFDGLSSRGVNAQGRVAVSHLRNHYTSGLEFAYMMLEYNRFTGTDITDYLPTPEGMVKYYDHYFQKVYQASAGTPLDSNGHIVLYPSDALEGFHSCTNNTDAIAGLLALTNGLLALPENQLDATKRAYYSAFKNRIPAFHVAMVKGHPIFAVAEKCDEAMDPKSRPNVEFPNMYPSFPFATNPIGSPGFDTLVNTWKYGATLDTNLQRQNLCWYQSNIHLARLGMTDEAAKLTLEKFRAKSLRFPVFYDNGDWWDEKPDVDHGTTAMIGLQEMLMQTDGKRILLGAAWPKEWSCSFRLHAPYQTIIEGKVENGNITVTSVTPSSRAADIQIGTANWTSTKPRLAMSGTQAFQVRMERNGFFWNSSATRPIQWEMHDLQGRSQCKGTSVQPSGFIKLPTLSNGVYTLTFREERSHQLVYHNLIAIP